MRRRDFLIGSAFGVAVPLLGGSGAWAALQSLAGGGGEALLRAVGGERSLPFAVTYWPVEGPLAEGAIRPAAGADATIRADALASGDPAFARRGARVTCLGLLTGTALAAESALAALRRDGIRRLSIELEYPGFAAAEARRQQFWSYADDGIPNVGRSCAATLPVEKERGLALHVSVQRDGRPDTTGVLRLSPGRQARTPKLRRGRYVLEVSPGAGVLVQVDHADHAGDAARA